MSKFVSERVQGYFEELLDAAPDAIVIVDGAGRIELVNAQTQNLLGYSAEELVGRRVEMLIPQRFRDAHPRHRDEYYANPRTRPMGAGMELFALSKDGREIPVEISLSPLQTDDGLLVISAIRDVTAQRRAEAEIQKLNEQLARRARELEATNSELEAFSYSVSHDLRAPLRSIDGFSQALLEDYEEVLDAQGQDFLRRIRAATTRMGELIDDLLRLSRITRAEMTVEDVDLSQMAREIVVRLQKMTPQREVHVVIEEGLVARGDRQLLRVLLENLIGNAWKFSAKQSEARIEVGARQDEEHGCVFFVRDNGAGFDMTYADKLFGAFQRLHARSEFDGTGVGLATVQRVITRHAGRVWAEAEVGKGATFYFVL